MKEYNRNCKAHLTKICSHILKTTDCIVEDKYKNWLMKDVFCYHPQFEQKIGCGVGHLEVRNDGYGYKCFHIVRKDGTITDISYTTCIRYKDNVRKFRIDTIKLACRDAIRDITIKLKNNISCPFVCPITGEIVLDKRNIHIDHYDLTFDELFREWIKDKDLDELYLKTLESSGDGETRTYFDDENIRNEFREFHNRNTHLRAVSKKANLSTLKKKI